MPAGSTGSYLIEASSTRGLERTRRRSDTVVAREPGAKSPETGTTDGSAEASGEAAADGAGVCATTADGAAAETPGEAGLALGVTLLSQAATVRAATRTVASRVEGECRREMIGARMRATFGHVAGILARRCRSAVAAAGRCRLL